MTRRSRGLLQSSLCPKVLLQNKLTRKNKADWLALESGRHSCGLRFWILEADAIAKQLCDETLLVNLAHRIAWHRVKNAQHRRQLVRRQSLCRPRPQVLEVEWCGPLSQHHDRGHLLSPGDVVHADDRHFGDVGMRQQMALHVQRADLVSTTLDDIHRRPTEDSVRAVLIDCCVTCAASTDSKISYLNLIYLCLTSAQYNNCTRLTTYNCYVRTSVSIICKRVQSSAKAESEAQEKRC